VVGTMNVVVGVRVVVRLASDGTSGHGPFVMLISSRAMSPVNPGPRIASNIIWNRNKLLKAFRAAK
jgi:hypothetical protein